MKVNYAQNLNQIQALEALVCVFASLSGALSVEGGNWQIFHEMIIASGAKLRLNTQVISIKKIEHKEQTKWKISSDNDEDIFDGLVLAAPYVLSLMKFLTIALIKYLDNPTSDVNS